MMSRDLEQEMNDYYGRLREIRKKYETLEFPGGELEKLERMVEEIKQLDKGCTE